MVKQVYIHTHESQRSMEVTTFIHHPSVCRVLANTCITTHTFIIKQTTTTTTHQVISGGSTLEYNMADYA